MKKIITTTFLLLLLFGNNLFGQEKCDPVKTPQADSVYLEKFGMENNRLKIIISRYKNKRQRRVNRVLGVGVGKRDAASIFFTGNTIDSFICYAKNADTAYYGLRLYYAMYEKGEAYVFTNCGCDVTSKKRDPFPYGNKHTIVIVAMKQTCNSKGECELIPITKNKKIVALDPVAVNQGALCPPLPDSFCKNAVID